MRKKYIFRLYTTADPEDGDTVWVEANSKEEAEDKLEREYWGITRLDLLRTE